MTIIDVLSRPQAIRILLRVRGMAPCTKSQIIKYPGSSDRTKWLRLNDLREAGLIEIDERPRFQNARVVRLTPKGEEVADLLVQIEGTDPPAKGPCYRCRHSWQDDDGLYACTWNCPDRCIRGWHDGLYGCENFEEAEDDEREAQIQP